VLALACLPDMVRGYEQIKLGNVARYRQALASALTGLERQARDSAPASP
jgi:indolepyruvate ferredoxin oxidoreductase